MTIKFPRLAALLTPQRIDEALTDAQRNDRQLRKRTGLVAQQAMQQAVQKVAWADVDTSYNITDIKRHVANGDLIIRGTHNVPDAAIGSVVGWTKRILKQAGVDGASVAVSGNKLTVKIDRGHLVTQGATNSMDAKRLEIVSQVDEDVSQPIRSSGSTKRELPAHRKKRAVDQELAARRRNRIRDEEEGIDPDETEEERRQREEDEIFEAHDPFNMARKENPVAINPHRFDGPVRRVPRAKFLSKHKNEDGTFTERWMYLAQSIDDLVNIKRQILAGTDIPVDATSSRDGKEGFVIEQFGDVVWMTINGVKK